MILPLYRTKRFQRFERFQEFQRLGSIGVPEIAVAIELGDRPQLIGAESALHAGAVD
jgi:hypothetical protein